ncbi:MAG TPA: Maf family protein, partial [Azoarcus sp.]|nr:Maf family protein [Azoarcus sp.]
MKIVLASTSAYRRMLLERLTLSFVTDKPEVDETPLPNESPAATADRLALAKALAVAQRHPDALIIGSDQVAHIGDEIFGKPGTVDKARAQLVRMRGKSVTFHTALAVVNAVTGQQTVTSEPTTVRFRELTDAEITRYIEK